MRELPRDTILVGHAVERLREVPDRSVQCAVTSPPYYGLRDYGTEPQVWGGDGAWCEHAWEDVGEVARGGPHGETGTLRGGSRAVVEAQAAVKTYRVGESCARCGAWRGHLGLEPTPADYVRHLVEVMREVRRVLRDDGALWLVLGDSYATGGGRVGDHPGGRGQGDRWVGRAGRGVHLAEQAGLQAARVAAMGPVTQPNRMPLPGLKAKDLCMIPARVAMALQQPYYTGRIKDENDRVWLAAVTDGEGCIYIQRNKAGKAAGRSAYTEDNYQPAIRVSNSSEAFVRECARIARVGSVRQLTRRGRRTFWEWACYAQQARSVLRELYPYLVIKQAEARLAISSPTQGDEAFNSWSSLKLLHGGRSALIDFAPPDPLVESGWWLRAEVIWHKRNTMPSSVTDRPTINHEHVFLLTKGERYFFDGVAIEEPCESGPSDVRKMLEGLPRIGGKSLENDDPLNAANAGTRIGRTRGVGGRPSGNRARVLGDGRGRPGSPLGAGIPWPGSLMRNARSVWTINTRPLRERHYASFPLDLAERCLLAGTSERGGCPGCGAPWRRVVGKDAVGRIRSRGSAGLGTEERRETHGRSEVAGEFREGIVRQTVGWIPSCRCGAPRCSPPRRIDPWSLGRWRARVEARWGAPVPQVVLDSFMGAGTVGLAAKLNGRGWLGVELNPGYSEMARRRIDGTVRTAEGERRVDPDQRDLFGASRASLL